VSISLPFIRDRPRRKNTNIYLDNSVAPLFCAKMVFLLLRALICVILAPTIIAASPSGTFEIDLIFPRRGTWAPADAIPIVFAVQRPDLAPSLAISIISWTLQQRGTSNRHIGSIAVPDFDGSYDKPYLIQRAINNTSGIEGSWLFSWNFVAGNCTSFTSPSLSSSGTADPSSFVYAQHTTISEFNTSNSASSANWTTLTSAQNCGDSDGVALAVSNVLKVPRESGWRGFNASCAVFSPTGTTSNPCAVTIDAAAASSVSASLAYQVCLNQVNGTTPGKCTMPSSSSRVTASWPLVAFLCAIGLAFI
jgi:hypothetical protein